MGTRTLKVIAAICVVSFASATNANPLCALSEGPGKNLYRINDLPGYFFKVHPDGKSLSFIGEGSNILLNLETGAQHKSIGQVDPVWSPDGKFITHPDQEVGGLRFHDSEAYKNAAIAGDLTQSPGKMSDIQGVYQSIGIIDNGYRIVTDEDGMSVAEFSYSEAGPVVTKPQENPCANIENFATDLPMLSKDGRYVSVYDQESKSTKIYQLNGKNCELALDLGFPTGKVSFNQNSSQIAFHMDQFAKFDNGYFSGISKDKVKNVVVMNLTPSEGGKKLTPSSWALVSGSTTPGDGGYYPDFDAEGNVYHLEDQNNFFQFVKTPQSELDFVDFQIGPFKDYVGCGDCNRGPKTGVEILAELWTKVCKEETKVDMTRASILAMAMNPEKCRQLVNDFWTLTLGMTKEELLKSCPKKNSPAKETIGNWDLQRSVSAEQIISSRCVMCHTQAMDLADGKYPYFMSTGPGQFEQKTYKAQKHLDAISLNKLTREVVYEMGFAISDNSMPKGSTLTEDEKTSVSSYLKRKLLDFPNDGGGPGTQVIFEWTDEEVDKQVADLRTQYAENPEDLEEGIAQIKCQYNQKYCQAYIDFRRPIIEKEALNYPEDERAEYIETEMMRAKCVNNFGAGLNECRIFQAAEDARFHKMEKSGKTNYYGPTMNQNMRGPR